MSTVQHPSEVESRRERYAERHRELMQELAAKPPIVDNFDFDPTQVPVIRLGILGLGMLLVVGLAGFLGAKLGAHQSTIVENPEPVLHETTRPVVNEGGRRHRDGTPEYAVMVPRTLAVNAGDLFVKVKLSEKQVKRLEPQLEQGLFLLPQTIELSDEQLQLLQQKDEMPHEFIPSR